MIQNLLLLFEAPPLLLQLLLDGVMVGAIFALAAYGLALVWGVMNIINVAQGEFVILGGFVGFYTAAAGLHPFFGVPIAAVILFMIGWALYRLIIFRIVEQDLFISLLATFGLSILLAQLMNEIFGANLRNLQVPGFGTWLLFDGLVTVPQIKVVAVVATLIIAFCLVLFMRHSRLGQAIRATAQNARAARILGVGTGQVYAFTYALNAAICGAAGGLVVMIWVIGPFGGIEYTVRSFAIVVLAGLGNLAGVIAAAFAIGAAEQLIGFVVSAQFQRAFIYLVVIAILVWRSLRLRRRRQYLR